LDIALKLGNYIKSNLKDVEVIYTRSDDSFVELYKRAKIANEKKADLFISIHCNASPKPEPYGVETYVMGINKIEGNLELASKALKRGKTVLLAKGIADRDYTDGRAALKLVTGLLKDGALGWESMQELMLQLSNTLTTDFDDQ